MKTIYYKDYTGKWVRDLSSKNDDELITRLEVVRKGFALNGKCDIFTDIYYPFYTRVYQIGRNYHKVEMFRKYTSENGAEILDEKLESGRASDIIKRVRDRLTATQLTKLKNLMKHCTDGIIMPDGEFKNN